MISSRKIILNKKIVPVTDGMGAGGSSIALRKILSIDNFDKIGAK